MQNWNRRWLQKVYLNVVLCIFDAGLEPPLATLQHTLLSQAMCIETKKSMDYSHEQCVYETNKNGLIFNL